MLNQNNVKNLVKPLTLFFIVVGIATVLFSIKANAAEFKIPETAQEHLAMAEKYKEKAAQYRAEAKYHQQMNEEYKKKVAISPKSPSENPWIKEMRIHCDRYIKEADNLADEALKFSEYHLMRGKELQGQ